MDVEDKGYKDPYAAPLEERVLSLHVKANSTVEGLPPEDRGYKLQRAATLEDRALSLQMNINAPLYPPTPYEIGYDVDEALPIEERLKDLAEYVCVINLIAWLLTEEGRVRDGYMVSLLSSIVFPQA